MKDGYYIITAWRHKYIGRLPDIIRRKGQRLPFDVYLYRNAVFMKDPALDEKKTNAEYLNEWLKCRSHNEILKG